MLQKSPNLEIILKMMKKTLTEEVIKDILHKDDNGIDKAFQFLYQNKYNKFIYFNLY